VQQAAVVEYQATLGAAHELGGQVLAAAAELVGGTIEATLARPVNRS
jgi:hypothetical protein